MKIIKTICCKISFLGIFLISGIGCELETDNPNNLLEDGLNITAFTPMINGAEGALVRAYGNILAPYSTASDELIWIGSRDAWQQLNFGNVGNPNNEFTDAAYFYVNEARFWADEVIRRGEKFKSDPLYDNDSDLVRAYIYGAIIYIVISDIFDDFVIDSSKSEVGSPVGPSNMSSLYDTAIGYLNKALALNAGLTSEINALIARAEFSKGVWGKINPVNTSDPLVRSSAAVAAAKQALSTLSADFAYLLKTDAKAPETIGALDIAGEVNQRNEMRFSDEYIIVHKEGKKPNAIDDGNPATTISLNDPIDNIPCPALYKLVRAFTKPGLYPDYPVVSTRELHLIIAEDALARNDSATFTKHINAIRALDGLTAYSGQVDAKELLIHSRRVNLFLQGRRIADHYRFNDPSTYWIANTDATTSPGALFPITISEIQSNPNIN